MILRITNWLKTRFLISRQQLFQILKSQKTQSRLIKQQSKNLQKNRSSGSFIKSTNRIMQRLFQAMKKIQTLAGSGNGWKRISKQGKHCREGFWKNRLHLGRSVN